MWFLFGIYQKEKWGTLGRVPEIYTKLLPPIYGFFNGCIGQYGVIFVEQLLGYPPKGNQIFPLNLIPSWNFIEDIGQSGTVKPNRHTWKGILKRQQETKFRDPGSPSENGNGTYILSVLEVIGHPNHHLIIWQDSWGKISREEIESTWFFRALNRGHSYGIVHPCPYVSYLPSWLIHLIRWNIDIIIILWWKHKMHFRLWTWTLFIFLSSRISILMFGPRNNIRMDISGCGYCIFQYFKAFFCCTEFLVSHDQQHPLTNNSQKIPTATFEYQHCKTNRKYTFL